MRPLLLSQKSTDHFNNLFLIYFTSQKQNMNLYRSEINREILCSSLYFYIQLTRSEGVITDKIQYYNINTDAHLIKYGLALKSTNTTLSTMTSIIFVLPSDK